MKWKLVLFSVSVIISSGHIQSSFGQEQIQQEPSSSSKQLTNPTTSVINEQETESTPARQGPQSPGWGGLISGKKTFLQMNQCDNRLCAYHLQNL